METVRVLDADALQQFHTLQTDAVRAVTEQFYATHGSVYQRFGAGARDACREDLGFHLEFLRPVLEFGLLQPMVDYLSWLNNVLSVRGIPSAHVALSLDWLGEFYASHMAVQDGTTVAAALKAARINFDSTVGTLTVPPRSPAPWPEADPFQSALLAGNQRDAFKIVDRCLDEGRGLVDVELHVIQPSLYAIGEKWQTNQVSVAQEHMASAIVQSVMSAGLLRSAPLSSNSKRVLLACVEGNSHAIGLHIVSDAFQLAGWEVQFLGANVPTPALISQIANWKPHLVGLSVSFAQQLRVVKDVIAHIDKSLFNSRPAVIIGGLAINRFNPLAEMVGADAYSIDARAAVHKAHQMVIG